MVAGIDPAAAVGPRWHWHRWNTLSNDLLYALLKLRTEVFVVEQDCVFQDMDGLDAASEHLCALDEAGALIGYARLLPPGLKYPEASIGRVVVPFALRRTALGRALMAQALAGCAERYPQVPIRIGAQQRLQGFYEGFGFAASGAPYLEDGILHVEMLRAAGA